MKVAGEETMALNELRALGLFVTPQSAIVTTPCLRNV
jgi:hypothetical protein